MINQEQREMAPCAAMPSESSLFIFFQIKKAILSLFVISTNGSYVHMICSISIQVHSPITEEDKPKYFNSG